MGRPKVATGADSERCRMLATERHGVPWRRWAPILDEGEPGVMPGISGMADETHGLSVTFALAPQGRNAGASDRLLAGRDTDGQLSRVDRANRAGRHRPPDRQGSAGPRGGGALREARARGHRHPARRHQPWPRTGDHEPGHPARGLWTTAGRVDPAGLPTFRAPWEALSPGLPDDTRLLSAQVAGLGTWWLAADGGAGGIDGVEEGTGAAFRSRLVLQPEQTRILRLRLSRSVAPRPPAGVDAAATLGTRSREAAAFQSALLPGTRDAAAHLDTGTALARLLWGPRPADASVVDQVFAALGLAVVDPMAAQRRLSSLIDHQVRSSGASTEPPVAAWAALRIHELVVSSTGRRDHGFLERVFQALLDDYSRWVDRVDPSDRNPLQGGLLGLDGTGSTAASAAWMACYSVWMLSLAVELARDDQTYQDVAVTFLDTTLAMVSALDDMGGSGIGMWDENDGWYHDVARGGDGEVARVAVRSTMGLVPLLAVAVIPRETLDRLPEVAVRLGWSLRHDMDLEGSVVRAPRDRGARGDMLVSLVPAYRRIRVLNRLDRGRVDIPVPMACLLLDVLDRLRAFGGWDPRDAATLRSSLLKLLGQGAPVWANLLAVAMRRALRNG